MKLVVESAILVGVLLVLGGSSVVLAWRSFKIIFTSFPYEFNSDIADVKVQIQNVSGDSTLNVVLNVLEEVDDVQLTYAVALESNEGNYTTLINRSTNFCKFLKQRQQEPLLRLVYEDILKQSNFIKVCPVKKGTYTLQDYHIDEEMLPSYVPETNFYADLKMATSKGLQLFSGRLYGKIDKSKGFNNLKMFSLG